MGRSRLMVLGMMLGGTPLAAQGQSPGPDRASGPFYVGLGATVIPIVAGIALIGAGKGDFEQGPATAGSLLATGGLLLGPAVGDWAGGLGGRGFVRFGLRTVALMGGLMGGFAISWNNSDQNTAGGAVLLGGLGIAAGLAIWDLATVTGAVRRHRAKSVSVIPVVRPDARTLGVAGHLTF
jgi:hypothetical protein